MPEIKILKEDYQKAFQYLAKDHSIVHAYIGAALFPFWALLYFFIISPLIAFYLFAVRFKEASAVRQKNEMMKILTKLMENEQDGEK